MVCPSRDKPMGLLRLVQAVIDTTNRADVIAYVDNDQKEIYEDQVSAAPANVRSRLMLAFGDRVGPVASANSVVKEFVGYDIYGMIPDDAYPVTENWAEWCLAALEMFPNRVGVISPRHDHGDHVDMPFVSREWISATGWFACPQAYHFVWPVITGLIGEMTGIVHAPEQRFSICHRLDMPRNQAARSSDSEMFFSYVVNELMPTVHKVREAMGRD